MMKNKRRALRRHHERRVQANRARDAKILNIPLNDRSLGKLRNNHFGCGCGMCKPWKWGLDEDYPHSQKKKLKAGDS